MKTFILTADPTTKIKYLPDYFDYRMDIFIFLDTGNFV